jgi:hypothetical protein
MLNLAGSTGFLYQLEVDNWVWSQGYYYWQKHIMRYHDSLFEAFSAGSSLVV